MKLTPKQIDLLKKLSASAMAGHRNKLSAGENSNGTRLKQIGLVQEKFVAYNGKYLFLTDAGRAALTENIDRVAKRGKQ